MALNFPNSPADGDTYEDFYWDATAGIWRRQLSVTNLSDLNTKPINDLDDVDAASPNNDEILIYNSTSGNWENGAVGTIVPDDSVSSLSDTSITSASNGESLVYDGTEWINSFPILLENSEQTADYTLTLADAGKVVNMNKSGAANLTIPTNASVAFPVGTVIGIYNQSADDVTVAGDTGVTLRNAGTVGQYAEASLRKRATDEWVLVGG